MHTRDHTFTIGRCRPGDRRDGGFTLVELLIVIVILGILATVTVFAVRGITDDAEANAEATDLRAIRQATEAYAAQNGTNPDETQLVAAGLMTEPSDLHDVAVAGDGTMTITNVRTGAVVETLGAPAAGAGAGGGGGGAAWSGDPIAVAGIPAVSASNAGGANRVIWFGGPQTQAVWNAAVDAGREVAVSGMPGGDTLVIVPIENIADLGDLEAIMALVDDDTYNYSWVVPEDDVADFCDNFAGDPVPFSVCADLAALNVNAVDPPDTLVDSWPVAQIDGLFAP